ncbi:MAG: alpha/beta hydrolase, partial [Treponema sp.]|nr:alpha/beta hydrolase [Treponema sp.]
RRHPAPLLDCARAFTLIREHAGEWLLDPAKLGLMGFSAGGHLALSGAVFYDRDFAAAPGINPALSRPDALMLCYPVVVSGEFAHRGSFEFLLGKNPDPRLLELLSLEKQVREDMPPVFLWHTYADEGVPVENSLFLASALRRAGVSLEMHIFHEGHHGLSLATVETEAGNPANVNPHVAHWFPLCLSWLESRFKG